MITPKAVILIILIVCIALFSGCFLWSNGGTVDNAIFTFECPDEWTFENFGFGGTCTKAFQQQSVSFSYAMDIDYNQLKTQFPDQDFPKPSENFEEAKDAFVQNYKPPTFQNLKSDDLINTRTIDSKDVIFYRMTGTIGETRIIYEDGLINCPKDFVNFRIMHTNETKHVVESIVSTFKCKA
jgi:hypothetical protein